METRIKKKYVLRKPVKRMLNKFLICIIIFLLGMILVKNNKSLKKYLKENIYEKSISFINNKKNYDKYIGSFLSIKENKDVVKVSNNKIPYEKKEEVNNGIKLTVPENYPVPVLESGVVVFIGEKENYGNVIIVEQVNGIETLYGNINFNNIKLYDYLEKDEIIGESKNKELFLLFQKNGEYIDYKEQI